MLDWTTRMNLRNHKNLGTILMSSFDFNYSRIVKKVLYNRQKQRGQGQGLIRNNGCHIIGIFGYYGYGVHANKILTKLKQYEGMVFPI